MLKVVGSVEHIDQVLMPSECLIRFRKLHSSDTFEGHEFYWAIKHNSDRSRIAYLIKAEEIAAFRRPGIRSIIPAYRKGR